jgi:hypothetical protein
VLPVTVYRGPEKLTVQMELSSRTFDEFPLDPALIAERLQKLDEEIMHEIRTFFADVSEEEAEYKSGPEEWSAKETLAHLVDSEWLRMNYITELMADGQREYAGADYDPLPRFQAMLDVTPTVPELLDRMELGKREVVALLRRAEKLKARKGVLWNMTIGFLQYPNVHERSHLEQIKSVISSARGASA